MESTDCHLRYLDASHVQTPVGALGNVSLVSPTNDTVGKLDGVVIDPAERRVRYFVVESRHWFHSRRYLLPATPCHIEPSRKALVVDVEQDDIEQLPEVGSQPFPTFSDEDAISAMFAPRAA